MGRTPRFSTTKTKTERSEMEHLKQENARLQHELAQAKQLVDEMTFAGAVVMSDLEHTRVQLAQTVAERDQIVAERDQARVQCDQAVADRFAVLDRLDELGQA